MDERAAPAATPPVAKRIAHVRTVHGIVADDPYAWLRADNWQEVMRDPSVLDGEIRDYLEAENAYAAARLADTEALQATLFEEMKGRIKEDDSTVPAPDGPYAYYASYVTGGQHPRFCRQARAGGQERVVVDGDALAAGKSYFQLSGVEHSPDHRLTGYGADDRGSEYYTLRIIEAETGTEIGAPVEDTTGGLVWAADSRTFFYTRVDENHRPSKVFRHETGTDPATDVLVYEEPDPGFFVGVGKTQSGAWIAISSHDHQTSEIRLIDAHAPAGAPRLVAARETGHEYDLDHQGERFLIRTNCDGAEDFKIVETPVADPARANWRDVVAHRPGRLILSHAVFAGHMARLERENGLPRIVVTDTATAEEHAIAFDEEAYSLGLSAGYEYDTTAIRFTYSSMTTPNQVYDYDMATRERTLRKTQEVPSGHDPERYVTRRVLAPAADGETVPVSLLYRKDTPLDGTAPLLLYGYGAYGITIPASFSTTCLSLVDRGFVYAIAHVRGGKDKGYRWYKAGRREHKANTFTDFIAAGEHLAAERFTTRGRIVAHGGSAGGMLMGAVANMAPDLFAGVIAEVPFVDVLTTMLDDTLPLTPPEWTEWGNPIEDAEAYRAIAAYSPCDNVRAQAYPNILALAGLTDPRVTYWEPAKWVARLRALKIDDNLALLRTNMDAGHGGASGRFERLKEVALAYAFALKVCSPSD
jgi:oligopeptidase B